MYYNSFWRRIFGYPKTSRCFYARNPAVPVYRRRSTSLLDYVSVLLAFCCLMVVLSEKFSQNSGAMNLSLQDDVAEDYTLTSTVSNYGSTMDEIAENLRDLPYEVAVCFDGKGNFLSENTDYLPSNVTIAVPNLQNSGFWAKILPAHPIILHNHPADVPFSLSDLEAAAASDVAVCIAVSSEHTYIMKPPRLGWPDKTAIDEWVSSRYFQESYWVEANTYKYGTVKSVYSTDELMYAYADFFGASYTVYAAEQSLSKILQLD